MEFYKEIEFKNTEIGEIPKNWRISDLGSECKIIMGQSPPSRSYNDKGEGLPFFQGNMDFEEKHPKIRLFCSEPKKIAQTDDILISVRAPVGELNIADRKCCIGRGLAALGARGENYRDYLYYSIKHFIEKLIGQGSTFKAIGKTELFKFKLPFPRIEEQREIASILSKVDDLIQKTDEIIQKTQLLKKGLMQELLTKGIGHKEFKYSEELACEIPKGWDTVKIGDSKYSTLLTGGTPSTKKKNYWNGTVPWMASGDIHKKYIKEVPGKISQEGLKNSAAKYIPINSVLVALNGQGKTKGTVAINLIELTCNQSIAAYVLNKDEFNPFFVFHYLTSQYIELRSLASNNDRAGLNLRLLRSVIVPKPFLSEQYQIASILSNIDDQIEKERRTKEQLERMKKGLMQILLTGKVRIKVN